MKGEKVGYIRVSSFDQNPERKLQGITLDRMFTDKASGKSIDRPKMKELIDYVRVDDTVVAHSMGRLARGLKDLRHLVDQSTQKSIKVLFIKENLLFSTGMFTIRVKRFHFKFLFTRQNLLLLIFKYLQV